MFANKLKELRKKNNITQIDLAQRLKVATGTIGNWETGNREPDFAMMTKISELFGVSVDFLLGNTPEPTNGGVMIPVYGDIAAGIAIEMIVDVEDYEEISAEMARKGPHFGLRIHGDSMSPNILNDDVVIIRKQDTCEDGDICAVMINGNSATCKKVKRGLDGIMLISYNQAYDPMFFSNKQIEELPVRVLGKVVELRRKM